MPRARSLLALSTLFALSLGMLAVTPPASAQRVTLVEEIGFFT